MGLSDSERTRKVIWSVHHLTNMANELVEQDGDYFDGNPNPYLQLRDHLLELWPILLAGKGNNGFWLFGSNDNVESELNTLWSLALSNKIMSCGPDEDLIPGRKKRDPAEYIYDCLGEQFGIEKLLPRRDAIVFRVYEILQQIQYAANRYKDQLSEQYLEVNRLVAKALGTIFYIFNEADSFTIAWLKNEIAELLIGKTHLVKKVDADIVQSYIDKNNEHHTIKSYRPHGDQIFELKKILADLTVDHSVKGRVKALVKMTVHHAERYSKIMNQLKELADSVNVKIPKVKAKKKDETSEYQEERDFYRKNLLGIKQ